MAKLLHRLVMSILVITISLAIVTGFTLVFVAEASIMLAIYIANKYL